MIMPSACYMSLQSWLCLYPFLTYISQSVSRIHFFPLKIVTQINTQWSQKYNKITNFAISTLGYEHTFVLPCFFASYPFVSFKTGMTSWTFKAERLELISQHTSTSSWKSLQIKKIRLLTLSKFWNECFISGKSWRNVSSLLVLDHKQNLI